MTSDVCVCLPFAYIGPNKSRTERPRKTKIGTEAAHVTVTRTPLQGQKVKGQGHHAGYSPRRFTYQQAAAAVTVGTCSPWDDGNLLLRCPGAVCTLQVRQSARRREALRSPPTEGGEGGAYLGGRPPTPTHVIIAYTRNLL